MPGKPRRKVELELLPDGTYELTLVQWKVESHASSWDERRAQNHSTLADAQRQVYTWFKGIEE